MTPDRCGFGRPTGSLPAGDRQAVEDFARFLAGEIAVVAATGEFVPLDRVGEPGVVTRDVTGEELRAARKIR